MLKHYVFWGLFALVLIGIAGTLMRDRRNRVKREAAAAQSRAGAAAAAAAAPPSGPARRAAEAVFDPAATRVHVRTAPIAGHAALPDRAEATLPSEAAPRLVCLGGTQKDHSFTVTVAGIRVGRATENDVVITDPRASNHHAWLGIVDRKVVLRDLGSLNGTFLNAQIDTPVSEVVLSPGDTIFFGGHGRDQFRLVVD